MYTIPDLAISPGSACQTFRIPFNSYQACRHHWEHWENNYGNSTNSIRALFTLSPLPKSQLKSKFKSVKTSHQWWLLYCVKSRTSHFNWTVSQPCNNERKKHTEIHMEWGIAVDWPIIGVFDTFDLDVNVRHRDVCGDVNYFILLDLRTMGARVLPLTPKMGLIGSRFIRLSGLDDNWPEGSSAAQNCVRLSYSCGKFFWW